MYNYVFKKVLYYYDADVSSVFFRVTIPVKENMKIAISYVN
jgi:hypothetical protein